MRKDDLLAALKRADDNEAWVAAIAAWFDVHDLHFGHGTDNAADEAYWLLRELQGWDDALWSAPANTALAARAAALAEQRALTRKPLAYLLGSAWFCGLRFEVDERVLVPRSPFAEIIAAGFEPWLSLHAGDRLLDIGTGSGCIAIAAALRCPGVSVDATDASSAALAVARRNVALHEAGERVRLHLASLFPRGDTRYRVIMSNPPYVPETDYATLPQEYLHEPREGLVGGPTGLEPAWSILAGCPDRLTDDGIVILEVGAQADAFAAAVPGLEAVWVEFEHGGEGVCVIEAAKLRAYLSAARLPQGIE